MLKIAMLQISSQNNIQDNIAKILMLIEAAADRGADIITLPENAAFMSASAEDLLANTYDEDNHPALSAIKAEAAKFNKWILIGSLAVRNDEGKLSNRAYMINNHGEIAAKYDKIHLYDAVVTGGESHQESKRFSAGSKVALVETPWGKAGLTICYDLRFPHLFRFLAKAGASFIFVPAAFTKFTGEAHWHVLLRARAIENGCYIIAPAQTGVHPSGRFTYGHSLAVDPWGRVIADAGLEEGVTIVEIDTDNVVKTRQQLPCLEHDRDFD